MSNSYVGSTSSDRATGMQCVGAPDAQKDSECCGEGGDLGFESLFCDGICVFCCLTCSLGPPPDVGGVGNITPSAETPAVEREFPTVVPNGNGLQFTLSAYGLGLPIVFGSDLLQANVFWHSGFEEKKFEQGGETFFYTTTSMALGICEGEINNVLRFWLGERLLINNVLAVDGMGVVQPNADGFIGGFTVDLTEPDSPLANLNATDKQTRISIFSGSTSQLPEGVMASVEGFDLSPGYRGVAYILVENLIVTDAIPAFQIEVSSNTTNLYPRLYAALPVGMGAVFGEVLYSSLLYDPSYDIFYMPARNVAPGPVRSGFVMFDGNTLDFIDSTIVHGVDSDGVLPRQPNFEYCHVLTNGNLWLDAANGNAGEFFTFNPFSSTAIDEISGGGLGGHTATALARQIGGSVAFKTRGRSGLPVDVVSTTGPGATGAIGFAEIDDVGQITMAGFQNGTMPSMSNHRNAVLGVSVERAEMDPEFPDGGPTLGTNIFYFSWGNAQDVFTVHRASLSDPGSTTAPVITTSVATISFDDMGGSGFGHDIYRIMTVDADGTFILFVAIASTNRPDRLIKWDPFTHSIVWNVELVSSLHIGEDQDDVMQILYGTQFCWVSNDDKVYKTDLDTGETTVVISSFTDQGLPLPIGGANFYNAVENSLTYLSSIVGQELVKVFLERASRAQVPVTTIVSNLLERVGWNNFSTVLSDLSALSLDGYTINNPTTLRAVFSDLKQVFRFDIVESNGKILYKTRGGTPTFTIEEDDLGNSGEQGWLKATYENDFVNTRKLNLTYRDLDRDYKPNVQSIQLPKDTDSPLDNDSAISVDVPIVLTSEDAKKLAEILIYSKLVYENTFEGTLPTKYETMDPGDVVYLEDDGVLKTIRIRDAMIGQDYSVKFTATTEDPDIYDDQVNLFGNLGRYEEDGFDRPPPRIDPLLIEISARDDDEAASTTGSYLLFLTLLNLRVQSVPDAVITVVVNGQDSYTVPRPTSFPTWGYVMSPLARKSDLYTTDYTSSLQVKIVSQAGAAIASAASKLDLLNNSEMNLAYVGGELIQYETVVDNGNNLYTFTGLHRARRGTERASVSHVKGEHFVLLGDNLGALDEESVRVINIPLGDSPKSPVQIFVNTGNPFQPAPILFYRGLNLTPRIPGDIRGKYVGQDVVLSWQRRNRYAGEWEDDGSEQLAFFDGTEEYTIFLVKDPQNFSFADTTTYYRKIIQPSVGLTYALADQIADGFDNLIDTLYVFVSHSGNITGQDPGGGGTTIVYPRVT